MMSCENNFGQFVLKKTCQYVDFWCSNRRTKSNQLDMVRSQSVTFLSQACDTVWGWGNPSLTMLLEGGDGEGKMRRGSFLWGNSEIKQILTS
jgi:hypothetical protein